MKWRPLTLVVTLAWFLLAGAALAWDLNPPVTIKIGLALATAYLALVAAVQQLIDIFLSRKARLTG